MSFIKFYNSLREEFLRCNSFLEVRPLNNTIDWPAVSGVYLVWNENTASERNLIYIGMTGTFRRIANGTVEFNNGLLNDRPERWTPYRFSEQQGNFQFHFRYGPFSNNTSEQYQIRNEDHAYTHSIPYNNLIIHCFVIDSTHPTHTPKSIESLLITKYIKETGTLPAANNSL